MTEITGRTAIWGILADPIHHVKTPQALNSLMQERGVDGVLIPFHVGADDLTALVSGLKAMRNLKGFVVTVPHKTAIVDLCDDVSKQARAIGAVNTVRREADGRLVGEMLDGAGFVAGLRENGIEPRGRRIYLAGAGGAANAIAFALAEAGVSLLTIANRTLSKSEDLRQRLAENHPSVPVEIGTGDPSGHEIVVNATSLGLKEGDPLPLDVTRLTPDQTVAEIIMQPEVTALMAAARERGCRTHPGRPMLACQLELMAEFMEMRP
ncbi:shikimate dehydrogenase family protein [Microvirga makkahensis]|uniref:shikimate dehydrogenase (NADP(+)) n=1 Tax=Microvirga makkahensis TaxID=1128670 RepID=A0A7X3SMS3_9HYPH|nr:shikimate dehydrogenase [Microvirga makkahensis]MXQ10596.1 shikimate dehydrogenase [Microvirga makkahensis]